MRRRRRRLLLAAAAFAVLLTAMVLLLVFTQNGSAAAPPLHKHKDVLSSATTHREALPISESELSRAIGNRAITAQQQQRAAGLAVKRWGGTNCQGKVLFLHADLYPVNIIAQSEWQTGANAKPFYACKITLNSRRATLTFPYFCAMMSHEYGHLAGFHSKHGLDGGIHSADPASVMYPVLSGRNIPRYCRNSGLSAPIKANEKARPLSVLAIGSTGNRVRDLQWLLKGGRPSVYRGVSTYPGKPTGVFGRPTAEAVVRMKKRLGWPLKRIHAVAGRDLIEILEGRRRRPLLYISRALTRLRLEPIHAETACAQQVVATARKEVGVREHPPGSNNGPRVNQYQSITGAFGVAWCASFDQWVFVTSGYGKFANGSAYVLYIRQWAYANALLKAEPKIGALAIFYSDSHHIGIVARVDAGGIYTIEGNSSDMVVERYRPIGSTPIAFVWLPNCHYPIRAGAKLPPGIIPDLHARPSRLLAPT